MIRTKSVYSPIDRKKDGLRILATRIRGRGLRKSRYHEWMANLGPSEKLLLQYRSSNMSWADFARRYRRELFGSSVAFDKSNQGIKNHGQKFTLRLLQQLGRRGNVTLMCHCDEDQEHCHRHLLAKMLAGKVG
jgi:uncharacterized protein YeaO (DUF488 family)